MQQGFDMSNKQLLGKHKRLREELSAAYAKPSSDTAHIDRITSELAAVERLLAFGRATELTEADALDRHPTPVDRLNRLRSPRFD